MWGTFIPNFSMLGLWVLDGQTDRQTDGRTKATFIAPFPVVKGIKTAFNHLQ